MSAHVSEKHLKIFTGTANPLLAQEIADELNTPLGDAVVGRFRDGEIQLRINETVRGASVFVIQPTSSPADAHIMELLIMVDAMRRASAREVAAVIPYYGYARQDRKTRARDPIAAKLVANLLVAAGADRVITMDLHAGQIQGFFDIPMDNLRAMPILANYLIAKELVDPIVVAPDIGGVARARELATRMHCGLAIIDKRRPEPNVSEVMHVIGKVAGRTAILVDDIIDTGGTLVHAADALLSKGAKSVYACATHPVFSAPAVERLESSALNEVVVTNTIPQGPVTPGGKIRVISVAPLFAQAIQRIFSEESVSVLFN